MNQYESKLAKLLRGTLCGCVRCGSITILIMTGTRPCGALSSNVYTEHSAVVQHDGAGLWGSIRAILLGCHRPWPPDILTRNKSQYTSLVHLGPPILLPDPHFPSNWLSMVKPKGDDRPGSRDTTSATADKLQSKIHLQDGMEIEVEFPGHSIIIWDGFYFPFSTIPMMDSMGICSLCIILAMDCVICTTALLSLLRVISASVQIS
ncbi:hypothetical protein B0T20DRAFT_394375 [Sordaria brevicollis]|uniref:Uncharacterized protein n=1 Tax=Sordaria brevicollis TaxID=83679 RepID=A0AAE0UB38_SORBR|nr:hypothetical protein B0T20DRAFT_394375 [Sordaria brevicollis]